MKASQPNAAQGGALSLVPEPESMQKSSGEALERIAQTAHELYEQRGRHNDRGLEDWLEAEPRARKAMGDTRE